MENSELENKLYKNIDSKLVDFENIKLEKKITDNFALEPFMALEDNIKNHFFFQNYADNLFDEKGGVNDVFFKLFNKFADSGVSIICSSGEDVMKGIDSFNQINANKIRDKIFDLHSRGVKLFLTLKTTMGRISKFSHSAFLKSSSLNREYYFAKNYCFRVLDGTCKKLAKRFAIATGFAKKAGFDGVLIDGSLSNLLGEMTSSEFNRRVFGYFSEEIDLPKLILEKVGETVKNIPILYKISPFSYLLNCFSENKITSLVGLKFNENKTLIFDFLANLVLRGVDGFVFEFGTIENQFLSEFSPFIGQNLFNEFYEKLEDYFKDSKLKNKFGEDVLLVRSDNFGKFSYKKNYKNIMYNISKEIYSDLNFVSNVFSGKPNKHCIRCGICKKLADEKNKAWCTVNPELVYELGRFNKNESKKVAIIGAGTSGIIAANVMAKRGLEVELFDREGSLNKNGRLCEVFGNDKYLKNFNDYIETDLKQLSKENKLTLKLGEVFHANNAKNYDAVVVATGFKELFLGVPGAVLKSVASIFDILSKKITYNENKHIIIYARSELAFKLALCLAKNHNVTILISNEQFLNNIPQNLLSYYLLASKKLGIEMHILCQVKCINEDSVEIYVNHKTRNMDFISICQNLRSGISYNFVPQAKVLDCDLFIYDPELTSNNKLFYDIVKTGYLGEVYMIGDALEVSDLCEEVKSAYFVGNNI